MPLIIAKPESETGRFQVWYINRDCGAIVFTSEEPELLTTNPLKHESQVEEIFRRVGETVPPDLLLVEQESKAACFEAWQQLSQDERDARTAARDAVYEERGEEWGDYIPSGGALTITQQCQDNNNCAGFDFDDGEFCTFGIFDTFCTTTEDKREFGGPAWDYAFEAAQGVGCSNFENSCTDRHRMRVLYRTFSWSNQLTGCVGIQAPQATFSDCVASFPGYIQFRWGYSYKRGPCTFNVDWAVRRLTLVGL